MSSVLGTGIVLCLLGAAKLCMEGVSLVRSRRAARWPTVRGEVVVRTVTQDGASEPRYEPLVSYRFHVGERLFVGSHTLASRESHAEAEAALAGYRKGGAVLVHYNPANPKESMLDPADLADTGLGVLAGALMLVVGIGLLLIP